MKVVVVVMLILTVVLIVIRILVVVVVVAVVVIVVVVVETILIIIIIFLLRVRLIATCHTWAALRKGPWPGAAGFMNCQRRRFASTRPAGDSCASASRDA